jgi:hypothetical protein
MSKPDLNECAAGGLGPYRALRSALDRSVAAWTGMLGDMPVCMFGVCPVGDFLSGVGAPWFLSSPELQRYRIYFLKRNREFLQKMLDIFPLLIDFVDVRHVRAIRWLKWLGFTVEREPVPFGPFGMPFYKFEKRK